MEEKYMVSKWKIALALIITVLALSALVREYEIGFDQGYATGLRDGSQNPVREIENQIHNRGFELGWQSGSGQPTEILPDNEYIVLVNLSENDVFKAMGKNKTSSGYYLLVMNHIRARDGTYNESAGAGWNGPEYIMVRGR